MLISLSRKILTTALLALPLAAAGQRVEKASCEYTYVVPSNITIEDAKQIALTRAKTQAIADAFGTVVSRYDNTHVINSAESSKVDFTSFGGSEVRGEWMETIGEPAFDVTYQDGMLVVKAKVKGKVREFTSEKIDLKIKPLRNGTEERCSSSEFLDGDDLYLLFQSPVKGNLLVFLIDEQEGVAYQILPYASYDKPVYRVDSTAPYIFFSIDKTPYNDDPAMVDEYSLNTQSDVSFNDLYVLFSPAPFTNLNSSLHSSDGKMPRSLPVNDFWKWLSKIRSIDTKLNLEIIPLKISKKS